MEVPSLVILIFCWYVTVVDGLAHGRRQVTNNTETSQSSPKLIIDNDWGPTDFTQILMALASNYTVLGLVGNTANSWALQASLQAIRSLELGNLTSCVPVYKGSDYPLLNNPNLFRTWEFIHGMLPWQGVMAGQNDTAEALGAQPTDGDPSRVSPASFVGGEVPDQSMLAGYEAAWFMIESVRQYPGEVSIYVAGALTNVALAVRLDSTFARNVRELVVMGGYIDTNLFQVTGDIIQADINSDLNLKIDPEAAKIAINADFPNITLVANAANSVFLNASDYEEIATVNNSYTQAWARYSFPVLPLWDATGLATLLYRDSIVTNSTKMYADVDVSWFSPHYGNIRAYQVVLAPMGQNLSMITYPFSVDVDAVKRLVKDAMMQPPTCPIS